MVFEYEVGDLFPNGDSIGAVVAEGDGFYIVESCDGEIYVLDQEQAEAYMNSEVWDD